MAHRWVWKKIARNGGCASCQLETYELIAGTPTVYQGDPPAIEMPKGQRGSTPQSTQRFGRHAPAPAYALIRSAEPTPITLRFLTPGVYINFWKRMRTKLFKNGTIQMKPDVYYNDRD